MLHHVELHRRGVATPKGVKGRATAQAAPSLWQTAIGINHQREHLHRLGACIRDGALWQAEREN